jgi:hypothetical protein
LGPTLPHRHLKLFQHTGTDLFGGLDQVFRDKRRRRHRDRDCVIALRAGDLDEGRRGAGLSDLKTPLGETVQGRVGACGRALRTHQRQSWLRPTRHPSRPWIPPARPRLPNRPPMASSHQSIPKWNTKFRLFLQLKGTRAGRLGEGTSSRSSKMVHVTSATCRTSTSASSARLYWSASCSCSSRRTSFTRGRGRGLLLVTGSPPYDPRRRGCSRWCHPWGPRDPRDAYLFYGLLQAARKLLVERSRRDAGPTQPAPVSDSVHGHTGFEAAPLASDVLAVASKGFATPVTFGAACGACAPAGPAGP